LQGGPRKQTDPSLEKSDRVGEEINIIAESEDMRNDNALNEAIQVEKIPRGFIVAVFFHGATELWSTYFQLVQRHRPLGRNG
jgi:hypothetical protein